MNYKDFQNAPSLINEVYAYDPEILSESYDRFDSIINKFGPEKGKYLLPLPGKQYQRNIINKLANNGLSQGLKSELIAKLLPGGKRSAYFYPSQNIDYVDPSFLGAAREAKKMNALNYIIVNDSNVNDCFSFEGNEFNPNVHETNEWLIPSTVNTNDALEEMLTIVKPIVLMHSELHYLDQNFSPDKRYYMDLWTKILLMANAKTTFNIYSTDDNKILNNSTEFKYKEKFKEALAKGIKINIFIYKHTTAFHKRIFYGEYGGWKSDRGLHLSHADTMFFDFTAIGKGSDRLKFLESEEKICEYFLSDF